MKDKVSLSFKPEAMRGVVSIGIFAISAVLFGGGIAYATMKRGNAGVVLGLLGIVILLCSLLGMGTAISGLLKKDRTHKFSRIGLLLNVLSLLSMIAVYVGGVLILL